MESRYFRKQITTAMMAGGASFIIWSPAVFASVADDFRFESGTFMQKTLYRRPEHVATDIDQSGAESPINITWNQTHTGKWYIEQQRYGGDAVCAGVAKQDTATIERGLKILHWGLEQQQPDGSFDCPDTFHSTSFFVEAAAHTCLLLKASPYADQYASTIEWMKPRILKAARWMIQPAVEEEGKRSNAPYAHRRFLVAAALGEAGVLGDDQTLIEKSKDYIRDGIAMQDPSGYNPERGGYDSSYHAVGLFYAERYYDVVADSETKASLRKMLDKGYAWLASRILQDGTINPEGNTRTG
ncbi:MAG: hypothetical protein JOZ08_17365, partial [Verrucomicrobia bacterium]|nr:hypothetical protein [Verrucomicrobiota bacterium]